MIGWLLALVSLAPCTVTAQPLERAPRDAFIGGDFEEAIRLVGQALEQAPLERDDLLALLILRARAALALGREDAMRADARALASVAPDHVLGREIRPELREAFDEARSQGPPLDVRLDVDRSHGHAVIRAHARGDVAGLIRRIEIRARAPGQPWSEGITELDLALDDAEPVECVAVAVGPGGAVLARVGSDADPQRFPASHGLSGDGSSDDTAMIAGLAIGLGVAVAAAIVLTVFFVVDGIQGSIPIDAPAILVWDMP